MGATATAAAAQWFTMQATPLTSLPTHPHPCCVRAGPVGATAAAAAIKWITKDGLGALGRLVVGSRLGREFDADPQRWRMFAEAITTTGESRGGRFWLAAGGVEAC